MNRVILIGNLGADAELKTTHGGSSILVLRLATSEKWVKDGEKKERTDWHMCELWGTRGEKLAQYLSKGTKISIEGKIRYSSYDDRDGNKRYKTTIAIEEIELLGGGGQREHAPSQPEPKEEPNKLCNGKPAESFEYPVTDDELPF
jgi:single-strand DNA-binding protein